MDKRDVFEGLGVEDIKAIVEAGRAILKEKRDEAKTAEAEAKAEAQAVRDAETRKVLEELTEGDAVKVILKGEEVEATFVRLTEKRFVVETVDGKRTIMFGKFVGRA